MILVQNRQQQSNGSKLLLIAALFLLVAGCTPRFSRPKPPTKAPEVEEKPVEKAPEEEGEEVDAPPFRTDNQIALLLPFQLNRSTANNPTANDVQRAALALDFYQGFNMALNKLAGQGPDFELNVLDTRDNEAENIRIAQLEEVREAALIVGPVFPKEIHAFGQRADLSRALQISPLAASAPSDFDNPNLVTLTAPLAVHTRVLAEDIAKNVKSSDVILLYDVGDASSRQFLSAVRAEIQRASPSATVVDINDLEELAERARTMGTNYVVCGTVNQYQITPLLKSLTTLAADHAMDIRLFGHPNWEKLDFDAGEGLAAFRTRITTSYHVNKQVSAVRQFEREYRDEFGVEPSEFSFKGYDAGYYFGRLLAEYGRDYRDHITKEEYDGMHNTFRFIYDPAEGFVNSHVLILEYRQGEFRALN